MPFPSLSPCHKNGYARYRERVRSPKELEGRMQAIALGDPAQSDGGSAFDLFRPESLSQEPGGPPHRASDFFVFLSSGREPLVRYEGDDLTGGSRARLIRRNQIRGGYSDPIPVADGLSRDRGHSFPRHQNPDQVQRIGRRQSHGLTGERKVSHSADRLNRYGQRELLAQESIDEPTAANFAAIFEPTESHQQLAPRRQVRLSRQHVSNHDSVAPQQHPAGSFDRARPFDCNIRVQQGPPPGVVSRTRAAPSSLPCTPFRVDQ